GEQRDRVEPRASKLPQLVKDRREREHRARRDGVHDPATGEVVLPKGFPHCRPNLLQKDRWRLSRRTLWSLVAQRLDRIQTRGLGGGIDAEEQTDQRAEPERQNDRP